MKRLSPCRTVVTSFNPKKSNSNGEDYFDDGDWVLCVAGNDDRRCIGCALSNGEVQIYDQNTLHLLQTYQRSNSLVTEMTFETFDPNLLASTASDGSVTLYDIRQQNSPVISFANMLRPDEEALSISMGFDGKIAAVGSSKGKIHFFDIRDHKGILGTYHQAHTNEVTRVRFQKFASGGSCTSVGTSPILVSGSEDGLSCVFDTSQPTEESAITNILTVESPIREVGFFGPKSEAIYCLTGSESLRLYHKDNAVCRKDFGPHFREIVNQYLSHHQSTLGSLSPMEYLVDCTWDFRTRELLLLTGTSKGDGSIFRVDDRGLTPVSYLSGGHRGVIRAWSSNADRSSFLTVGEDARLCEWNAGAIGDGSQCKNQIIVTRKRQGGPIARNGGGKLRKPRSRMSAAPY